MRGRVIVGAMWREYGPPENIMIDGESSCSTHLAGYGLSHAHTISHTIPRGPELVWATGRLMSPDRGFGTSCLLHCGLLTVSANSEDS